MNKLTAISDNVNLSGSFVWRIVKKRNIENHWGLKRESPAIITSLKRPLGRFVLPIDCFPFSLSFVPVVLPALIVAPSFQVVYLSAVFLGSGIGRQHLQARGWLGLCSQSRHLHVLPVHVLPVHVSSVSQEVFQKCFKETDRLRQMWVE